MVGLLTHYLGKPASTLLESPPFRSWESERSVDEDIPDSPISYIFSQHGLELACDDDERIQTIFLYADSVNQSLTDIPLSSSRMQVLEHFSFSSNHENALTLCFYAIPDGKPLHTFPGIALSLLGIPSKRGEARTDPFLGAYGPWDRFSMQGYVLHVEYQPHADKIKMITLMREDMAP